MTPTPSAVAAAERILAGTPHAGIDYPELRHRIACALAGRERATWAAAATEPITTVHTTHHSTDYCDGWVGTRAGGAVSAVSTPAAAMPTREGGPKAWTVAEARHVTTEGHECRMHGYRNCCACIVSAARWLLGYSLEQARELEEYHQLTRESAEVSEAGLAAIQILEEKLAEQALEITRAALQAQAIRFLTLGLPPTHTWTVAEIRARAAAQQETP